MQIKTCTRCVMDTTAKHIFFNKNGCCNYCSDFINKFKFKNNKKVSKNLYDFKKIIKKNNSKYDCIIGVSGGVDSSYSLVKCIELGLKPLAVHMDNGWNSSLAQNNISNLIRKLNVDLITYVINWKEYRSLMSSFFKSNVIDIELLYDHAMLAVNYKYANKFNIKNIVAGTNQSTEGFEMPKNWNWFKYDKKNIETINIEFDNYKIKSFPFISIYKYIYYTIFKRIKWISILDYTKYNKKEAEKLLVEKFNFQPYPYKHYESVFTRFYQGYILPKKFNIDKRKIHLSNLIMSNQITRKNAIEILKSPPYVTNLELRNDKDFFLKKMNWNEDELSIYLNQSEVNHDFYSNDYKIWKKIVFIKNLLK